MQEVLLVIHLILAIAIVITVLLQRSEGGALGIGGGGGGMAARGAGNVLTRTTAILAVCFFTTSIVLTILADRQAGGRSIMDAPVAPREAPSSEPALPEVPISD